MPLSVSAGSEPVPGYRFVRKLGQGGFGEVWEAEAPGGVRVAMKLIRLGTSQARPELRALEIIRNIRHPHLLDIQFSVQVDDTLLIAMPLCDQSLWDRFKESQSEGRKGLPRDELFGYMEELAKAVDYLNEPRHLTPDGHRIGIQHRDIKPHNVFLVGGCVRLADFGLAKFLQESVASHTGSMSPNYVAPEALKGTVACQSDQYSVAVTYYQLRTGRLPITGNTIGEIIYNHMNGTPDLSALPEEERSIVGRALSKEPEARWPNCQSFIANLRKAMREGTGDEPGLGRPEDIGSLPTDIHPKPEETLPLTATAQSRKSSLSRTDPDADSETFAASGAKSGSISTQSAPETLPTDRHKMPDTVPSNKNSGSSGKWRTGCGTAGEVKRPPWLLIAGSLGALLALAVLAVVLLPKHGSPLDPGLPKTVRPAKDGNASISGSDVMTKTTPDERAGVSASEVPRAPVDRRTFQFEPPTATVLVDGKPRTLDESGRIVLDLAPGSPVTIVARAEGFRDVKKIVRAGKGTGNDATIRLVAVPVAPPLPAPRPFRGERYVLNAIRDHLRKSPESDRKFQRFFNFANLHNNPKVDTQDLQVARAGLSKLVNSLSWEPALVVPSAVDPDQIVFCIDLRRLGWDRNELWSEVLKPYPYGLTHGSTDDPLNAIDNEVHTLADEDLPYVRADWFVATASRPPLYQTILRLPETARELEQRIGVDVKADFTQDKLVRAGLARGAVPGVNHVFERHAAPAGGYWIAYDLRPDQEKGDLFRFPLGPDSDASPFSPQAFVASSCSTLVPLPNGMQAYLLVDREGRRSDSAPAGITHDPQQTSGSHSLVNGISCIACHRAGVFPIKDEVRHGTSVTGPALEKVKAVYPEASDLDRLTAQDSRRFVTACEEVTASFLIGGSGAVRSARDLPEPVSALAQRFGNDLGPEEVAGELGVQEPRVVLEKLRAVPRLRKLGLEPLFNGHRIKRDVWDNTFDQAAIELDVGTPHRSF